MFNSPALHRTQQIMEGAHCRVPERAQPPARAAQHLYDWLLRHVADYSPVMAWEDRLEGPSYLARPNSALPVRLARPPRHPHRIAITKSGAFIEGGTFFLDFTRPIQTRRWFGKIDRHVGLVVGLIVPVIHEGEERGGHVICVDRSDPRFEDLCALWKAYYPCEDVPVIEKAAGVDLVADFAAQFPTDC